MDFLNILSGDRTHGWDGDTRAHVPFYLMCFDAHKCCTHVIRDQNDDCTETSSQCHRQGPGNTDSHAPQKALPSVPISFGKGYRTQIMLSSESLPGVSPPLAQVLSGDTGLSGAGFLSRM